MAEGLALLQGLQQQVQIANAILRKYGLSIDLKEIVLHYRDCEGDCIAYVYVVKCEYHELCEKLREQLKAQAQEVEDSDYTR